MLRSAFTRAPCMGIAVVIFVVLLHLPCAVVADGPWIDPLATYRLDALLTTAVDNADASPTANTKIVPEDTWRLGSRVVDGFGLYSVGDEDLDKDQLLRLPPVTIDLGQVLARPGARLFVIVRATPLSKGNTAAKVVSTAAELRLLRRGRPAEGVIQVGLQTSVVAYVVPPENFADESTGLVPSGLFSSPANLSFIKIPMLRDDEGVASAASVSVTLRVSVARAASTMAIASQVLVMAARVGTLPVDELRDVLRRCAGIIQRLGGFTVVSYCTMGFGLFMLCCSIGSVVLWGKFLFWGNSFNATPRRALFLPLLVNVSIFFPGLRGGRKVAAVAACSLGLQLLLRPLRRRDGAPWYAMPTEGNYEATEAGRLSDRVDAKTTNLFFPVVFCVAAFANKGSGFSSMHFLVSRNCVTLAQLQMLLALPFSGDVPVNARRCDLGQAIALALVDIIVQGSWSSSFLVDVFLNVSILLLCSMRPKEPNRAVRQPAPDVQDAAGAGLR